MNEVPDEYACATYGCEVSISAPGIMFVNNDDDDGNGIADYLVSCWDGPVPGENDLVAVTISYGGCPPASYPEGHYCEWVGEYQYGRLGAGNGGGIGGLYYDSIKTPPPLPEWMTWPAWGWWWEGISPPTLVYIDGSVASDACGDVVAYHCLDEPVPPPGLFCCKTYSQPVKVVQVDSLRWEKYAGQADNPELGWCANNGGLAIFPGKIGPNDEDGANRRKVDLVATIRPCVAGIIVHFEVFDVDDPFDQAHVTMPDVQLIDDDLEGGDNRPEGAADPAVGVYQALTDANGEARVTVEVSMQPGNNYRAGASCLQDAVSQATQETADLTCLFTSLGAWEGYFTPLVWSKMLTVWRKLHVETDTMVRPTFAQNTFTMDWNEPRTGPVATQVVFEVDDPPAGGGETKDQQFNNGLVELTDATGNVLLVEGIVDYVTDEGPIDDLDYMDEVTINIPDCGGGQSGLACLSGVTSGVATLSDDDLSDEATFTSAVWGCDDTYANPAGSIAPPDLSALTQRYGPAYILPVQDMEATAVQGLVTFLRNVDFGINDGKILWDQALAARNLPISTADFWTVMIVSAWQAEEPEDADPNMEIGETPGVTKGICTHKEDFTGDCPTTSSIPPAPTYTGIAAVFRAVFGEQGFAAREKYTVAHEIGHTFGLDHSDGGMMCASGDCQTEPLTAISLKKLREYTSP
jgi:hypothetical protein